MNYCHQLQCRFDEYLRHSNATNIIQCMHNPINLQLSCRRGGAVVSSVRPANGRLDVQIPADSYLGRENS